jgi:hypothetical protein
MEKTNHDPFLDELTPEQRKIRQAKIEATVDDLDFIVLLPNTDETFEESSKVFE